MLAVLLLSTVTQALPGSWEVGYATWYTGVPNGGGSCEFPKEVTASFPFGMYAAIDYTLYDDSKACGVCYEVECTGNPSWTTELCECKATSVVLQADSSCCTRDHNTPHFDLNPAARAAILQNDCGNMAVRFRQVACTYNSEGKNVQIVPKPGTTEWWYAFFVWDVAETGQVVKARIKSSGSSTWNDCPLKGGAFFECGGMKPYTAPITVELTDIEGEVLVADDLITDPSKDTGSWDFGTNFGKAGSPPVTRAPATSSPATGAPVTTTPSTDAPQTGQPTTAPDTQSPDTKAPDTTAPDTAAPSTLVPGTTAEPTAEPTTAPDTAVPTVAPDTSAPATTAPATGAPLTSSPKTTSPSTNAVTSSPVGSDTTGAPTTASPGTGTTSSPGTSSSPSTASPGTTSSTGTASPGGTPTAVPTPSPSSDDGVAVWVWILVAVLGTACIVAMVAGGAYRYKNGGKRVNMNSFIGDENNLPEPYKEMEPANL
eukprot:TRINITY_DN523_c0_g1_i6.p1 TRINITY_DN523_c0_g1~~TRINITY_DN523_c0_g1_i6.p1  ORF type:complete len:504 (+),score=121.10 TRINITY_DN523_c0_g1_i6:58-1512(+)